MCAMQQGSSHEQWDVVPCIVEKVCQVQVQEIIFVLPSAVPFRTHEHRRNVILPHHTKTKTIPATAEVSLAAVMSRS